jgi:hypothetical protein
MARLWALFASSAVLALLAGAEAPAQDTKDAAKGTANAATKAEAAKDAGAEAKPTEEVDAVAEFQAVKDRAVRQLRERIQARRRGLDQKRGEFDQAAKELAADQAKLRMVLGLPAHAAGAAGYGDPDLREYEYAVTRRYTGQELPAPSAAARPAYSGR